MAKKHLNYVQSKLRYLVSVKYTLDFKEDIKKKKKKSAEHRTLDLGIVSSSSALGVQHTLVYNSSL